MRDLTSEGVTKTYDLPSLFPDDENLEPVSVIVGEHDESIDLTIGENVLKLSVQQARDLALTLRKHANIVEKSDRERQWIK